MQNIVACLQTKLLSSGADTAYLFLADGVNETARIQYTELDQKARKIAAFLQKKDLFGQRILLLYQTGLDFIESFIGCLYAGVVAVPIACPNAQEFEKSATWLCTVADDADIAGIFTHEALIQEVTHTLADFIARKKIFVLDIQDIQEKVEQYQSVELNTETIAYLQYTSGSTSTPKAAIVTHGNLTHSLQQTIKAWHYTQSSITFTWAPHTHVYGLVCGLLVPLYHGSLAILMPPSVFVRHPVRWLKAISKYRVTHSGCPNFGYDLCVREIADNEIHSLDLHSWQVAVNGGESVRSETLRRFSEKFAACQFRLSAFNSAFGMSEVTGAIAVGKYNVAPKLFKLAADELTHHKVVVTKQKKLTREFVSSGKLLPGLSAVVVNPDTRQAVAADEIGEIWLSGPSVVSGYWRRPEETRATFQAQLVGSEQFYFRTGDFGFIKNNELCLTGRLKEVIVVNGKKYYPQDIENTVEEATKEFAVYRHVVFSAVVDANEQIIFVQEVEENISQAEQQQIISVIQHRIMQRYGIKLQQVILVKKNTIPKTVSGKLQRKLCEKQFMENRLQRVDDGSHDLQQFKMLVAHVLNLDVQKIDLALPVSAYQFDSINMIKLTNQLNEQFQLNISPAVLFEHPTLENFYLHFLGEKNKQVGTLDETHFSQSVDGIAIVGMSALLPGAENVAEFWQNMLSGKDVIREIPAERWDWRAIYGDPQTEAHKTNIKWGGFLQHVAEFDAEFFNISPREAELTDPQQRLFLQTTWHAIEDAGYALNEFAKAKIGLFVGVFKQDYAEILQKNAVTDAFITTGLTNSMLANRVSYLLNFHGPSEVIDTACSSSLVALHHAVNAIRNGDCEAAIVGGVNLMLTPTTYLAASKANMLSTDGRCKTFDKSANGYVRSEGVAAIVLKPLQKALNDHDHIYGVIKGTAVNHGGHVTSLTAPNPNAQAELIVSACQRANVAVDSIQYIEAHGTGTALGDPIEVNGLKKAFQQLASAPLPHYYCGVGSVKTHIGHLESAAGIAGVIKVLLALQHEELPGNLHFSELNPYLEIENTPFYITAKNTVWPRSAGLVRRAGVSSFGFGGTNAHVILEECSLSKNAVILSEAKDDSVFLPIAISAKTESALQQRLQNMNDWLQQQTHLPNLSTLSYTLNVGRQHFACRRIFIVKSCAELLALLQNKLSSSQTYPQHLAELANAYLAGKDVNWESLYTENVKQRISLPTYPFARETHWITENRTELTQTALHPLLDKNNSTLELHGFSKEFTGHEFYLQDHKIRHDAVLPGAISIEMARAAGQLINPTQRVTNLQNIIWTKPVIVQSATRVHLNLAPKNSVLGFSLTGHENVVHVEGEIVYGQIHAVEDPLDLSRIKQTLTQTMTREQFYAYFNSAGVHYGANFQTVTEVYHDDHAVLAKLILPQSAVNQEYVLHPSLLDGALQAVSVLLREKNTLFLPFSINQVEIYDALEAVCYVYATQTTTSEITAVPMFSLQMTDAVGNVLVNIHDFSLCAIQENELLQNGVYYYQAQWQQDSLADSIHAEIRENLLIFSEHTQSEYQSIFSSANRMIAQYNHAWRKQDYLNVLKKYGEIPQYIIVENYQNLQDYYQLVYIIQALLELKLKSEIQIICVSQTHSLYADALSGFAKSLYLENPNLILRSVTTSALQNLKKELSSREIAVRYDQQNQRWIKRYQPLQHAMTRTTPWLKQCGAYLITGGLGGLGLIFARYLAEQFQAKLFLTGRSRLSSTQQSSIEELEKLGAEVHYICADVTEFADSKNMLYDIHAHVEHLDGVIHAAGVINDEFLLKKTEQDITNVLAAKIAGVLNLDAVLKDEAVDLFVMFSSAAAVLGNSGQTDYAYANGFMDAFATERQQRTGKTISINWPLWAEGGAEMNAATQSWLKKTFGVQPLNSMEGITAFCAALEQDVAQFIVLSGNKNQIEQTLVTANVHASKAQKNKTELSITPELRQQVESQLKKIISSVIKLPTEKIKSSEPFENYGIDSVMIILLNQALEQEFGPLPKTLFFEYQSIAALTDYFLEQHTTHFSQQKQIASTQPLKVFQPAKKIAQSLADIAIIGISGRYPAADNLHEFWENLKKGKDAITRIPSDRWNVTEDDYAWGGFIQDVDKFDPLFFNISPREAELIDPQERLFLESAWHTVEDAGYAKENLAGKNVGVFVGVMYGQYQLLSAHADKHAALANSFFASIANRVSYYFDWHGPSIALDTMCSSSLTAIHLACKSLRDGECQLAIAGGVNISIHPHKFQLLNGNHFLASDGRCHSFGEAGDGYVPGEGVGSILLKPLAQALADHDHIYAVIKGSHINHGGKTNGYTVPNPIAQAEVIAAAYKNANIAPNTISYIEAHGTGTALGDPIEIAGLSKVFQRTEPCVIGSVKSNIGHCESAAGIAALSKVVLQMQHKQIVPSLHSTQLNRNIAWESTPFIVAQQLSEWAQPTLIEQGEQKKYPRRAGISSFGAGGSNAHFILEEAPSIIQQQNPTKPFYLICLSAKTEKALRQKIANLSAWLNTVDLNDEKNLLEKISYTLNAGRSHFAKRCACVVSSITDLMNYFAQLTLNAIPTNTFMQIILSEKPQENVVLQNMIQQVIKNITQQPVLSIHEYKDNLLVLAKLYVDGYDLPWDQLHQHEAHEKISLPGYPFARDRYWYSEPIFVPAAKETILATTGDETNQIQQILASMAAEILKIKSTDIEPRKNLSEYGMDSVGFIELAEKINQHYSIQLTPAVFYANNHLSALSHYLTKNQIKATVHKPKMPQTVTHEPIAIIGMQGVFPGANNTVEYWQNLINDRDCITEVPAERWNWRDYYGDAKTQANKSNSKWGGFIADVDLFDPEFFNLSAREANLMDPQQRLFLMVVWQAIEDAGYDPFSLAEHKVGVFAGVEFSEYQTLIAKQQHHFHGFVATGNSHSMLPNRVSYFLNLQGPSEAIDTACSSSLVAIHRAINAIRSGECEIAIAGGVSLMLDPHTLIITSQLGALSPDGRCKTFDKSANGYVKGEGVAAVLLKPLSHAQRDGDHIYAVIKGSAVNHGGKAQSLTAPNANAQAALLVDAYSQTDFAIETVSYIEAHGTGTALGDPVEIEGLKQAFQTLSTNPQKKAYCALGSVKTNIGHLEPASGMAGLSKVLLSMQHHVLPGNLHLHAVNPYISLDNSPFYLLQQKQRWQRLTNDTPYRAGISSFGFGGTNAHIVLEEVREKHSTVKKPCYLITLSAKQEVSLKQKLVDLSQWLQKKSHVDLSALAFTLNAGRAHFAWRCAFVCMSVENLLQQIAAHSTIINVRNNDAESALNTERYHSVLTALNHEPLIANQYSENLLLLADLYLKNYPIDWQAVYSVAERKRLPLLPSYPFAKQRYWFDIEVQKTLQQPIEVNTDIQHYLRQLFAEKLGITAERIVMDAAYGTYGIDSVLGLEITHRLQHDFPGLPHTILYEQNCLQDLANYLQLRKQQLKSTQRWLIFSDYELGFILHAELGKENCVFCLAGDGFVKQNETTYYLDADSLADYKKLFTEISHDLAGIIYLWPNKSSSRDKLLHLFQALFMQKSTQKRLFCLISRCSQTVQPQDNAWSMIQNFVAEQPNYKALRIDLPQQENLRIDANHIVEQLTTAANKESPWIAYRNKLKNPKLRLFCFPFGGAGASVYRDWQKHFPDSIEICPVQLPGRENRLDEQPLADMDALIEQLIAELTPEFDVPFAFFGHSLGALIAFELSRRLRARHLPQPIHLFSSAFPDPQLPSKSLNNLINQLKTIDVELEHLSKPELVEKLPEEKLRAVSDIFSANGVVEYGDNMLSKDIMKILLPIFVNDMSIVKSYRYHQQKPLDLPITVFLGKCDTWVAEQDHAGWAQHTQQHCQIHAFDSGHLFVKQGELSKQIAKKITEAIL